MLCTDWTLWIPCVYRAPRTTAFSGSIFNPGVESQTSRDTREPECMGSD